MHSGGSTGPRARARRSTELDRPWGGSSEVARLLRTDYKTLRVKIEAVRHQRRAVQGVAVRVFPRV